MFGDGDNSCSALMLPFWDKCAELTTVALKQTSRATGQRVKSRTFIFWKEANDLNIQKKTESAFKVKQTKIHTWKEISGFFFYFCSYLVKTVTIKNTTTKIMFLIFVVCSANVSIVIWPPPGSQHFVQSVTWTFPSLVWDSWWYVKMENKCLRFLPL